MDEIPPDSTNETPPERTPGQTGDTQSASNRVWGFWATVGLALVIGLIAVGAQVVAVVVAFIGSNIAGQEVSLEAIETNGFILALGTCVSAPVVVALSWLFVLARKGMPARDYLALHPVSSRRTVRWSIVLLGFILASDALTALLGRPIVPDFIIQAYSTARFLPLLWLALIVAAPFAEEFLFRGFIFMGLARSSLGAGGAIFLSALVWSAIHLQYDLYGMGSIFVGGLLLGYARWKTGSLYPPVIMHALMNLVATIEVTVLVDGMGYPE